MIGADLIRECAGVDMKDSNLLRLVDGVRAVVSDRFYIQTAEFLGIRLARVNGMREPALAIMRKKCPFVSKTLIPFGLAPNL